MTDHDYAGRAETTLTPTAHSYSLLCWMRLFRISDALNGNHMLAINTDDWRQACIDGGMMDLLGSRVSLGHDLLKLSTSASLTRVRPYHSAGSASPFGTSKFSSSQSNTS